MADCQGVWLGNQCSDPNCGKQKRHVEHRAVTPCPRCRLQYPLVHLSERSADMLKALEDAATQMGAATTYEEHHAAYANLTAVREVVYKRQEQLEKQAGVKDRPVAFRF